MEHDRWTKRENKGRLVELEGIEINGIIKIYVIDSVEYSTMILAEEY